MLVGRAGGRAHAAGSAVVVLVRPPAAPPTVTEALVHLRGELAAAGFAAEIVEVPVGTDVRTSLERVAPGAEAVAVVAVLPVGGGEAGPQSETAGAEAEMWVVDRLTGKTVVRRASADGDRQRAAEILSVRAVELLRASFVELAIMAERPPAAAAPAAQAASQWAATALEEHQRPWSYGLEVGGSVLQSFNGVGPAVLPMVRLERAFGENALVRLAAAGLGAPARVATASGFADVGQTLLLVEACWRFRAGRRLQPIVTAGGGALRFSAEGHASDAAYQAVDGTRWAAVGDVGAGARISLQRRVEVGLELHALVADPYPAVRFLDQDVARAGRPSFLASVTVLGGL